MKLVALLFGATTVAACGGAQRAERSTAETEAIRGDAPTADEPVGTIEERLLELHRRRGRGRPALSELLRRPLEAGGTQEISVTLAAGQCYTVLAVGDPAITDLDLYLHDPSGAVVAWDRGRGATPGIWTCVSLDGTYRLRVKAFSGAGDFGLQVFGEPATRGPAPSSEPIVLPLSSAPAAPAPAP